MQSWLQNDVFGRFRQGWAGLVVLSLFVAALTAALAPVLDEQHTTNITLLYLLLTLIVAATWGYRVGLIAAIVADLAVNFFFLPPLHTFTVHETRNIVSLVIFLAVAGIGASMLALLRREALRAEARRAEAVALLDLAQEMAASPNARAAVERLCFVTLRVLKARSVTLMREERGGWTTVASTAAGHREPTREEAAIATNVAASQEIGRSGGAMRQRARGQAGESATYVPLGTAGGKRAVLHVTGELRPPPLVEADRLLRAFASEAALALDRARLAEEASRSEAFKQADELKSVLISSVSHDLRSPLTAIKAAVGNLRDSEVAWTPEDTASFLEVIESQADRLTATVDGLLEVSRLEGGIATPAFERIEVEPLLADVVAATKPTTAGRDVECRVREAAWVRADYGMLMQVLTNLIENAAKYSTPGTPIVLSAEQRWPVVRIHVDDAGPAIAAADLPRIFEKFYRGTSGSIARGSGLGLAIVRAMVELCGGKVSVHSSPAGNRFTIELPAIPAPSQ